MSRAPGQKNRGPLRAVLEVLEEGGQVTFLLRCGHHEDRKRSDVTRVRTPRPRWPKRIACGTCGGAR